MDQRQKLENYKDILNQLVYRSSNQHRHAPHFQYLRRLNSMLKKPDYEPHRVKSLILKAYFYTRRLMNHQFFLTYCLFVISLLASINSLIQLSEPAHDSSLDLELTVSAPVHKETRDITPLESDLSQEDLMSLDEIPMIPSFSDRQL